MSVLVDILLPTFNGEVYIERQIKSILEQTHQNIRLIIRDDLSSDDTVSIVRKIAQHDSRILILEDELGNLGLVKNIEYLLSFTCAPLIMFSDQDDVWFPEKVSEFVKTALEKGIERKLLIHSNCWVTNSELQNKRIFKGKSVFRKGLKSALFNYSVQGASTMITRSLKEEILPFPSSVYLHDRYIHLITEILGERIYLDKPLMFYRQHDSNLVGSKSFFSKLKKNLMFKDRFFIQKDADLISQIYHQRFSESLNLKTYLYLINPKNNRFIKLFVIFRDKYPLRFKELVLLCLKN